MEDKLLNFLGLALNFYIASTQNLYIYIPLIHTYPTFFITPSLNAAHIEDLYLYTVFHLYRSITSIHIKDSILQSQRMDIMNSCYKGALLSSLFKPSFQKHKGTQKQEY